MRAFFAVDLPEALAPAIGDAQAPFADASGVNPVDPEQAHVTLKFLGDVPESDVGSDPDTPTVENVIEAGERAVDRAAVAPFKCTITGLGVFPNREYISVVWTGFDRGGDDLAALHDALEAETTALGVDPTDHDFTPHVTLARVENATGAEAVRDALDDEDPKVGSFSVDEVRLIKSTLTESGPEYAVVREFGLG
ncbi:RNA 2',3'-cyclic phosphodiesterase [Halorubrum sp. AS12]|uniref:RNA 2',3'-cyclic phosphodiesterase n=1 Tax=Halorubrum sp. AS12 TaxID=3409687 RepID=UPI003DA78112